MYKSVVVAVKKCFHDDMDEEDIANFHAEVQIMRFLV